MGAETRADGALLHKRVPQKDGATDKKKNIKRYNEFEVVFNQIRDLFTVFCLTGSCLCILVFQPG